MQQIKYCYDLRGSYCWESMKNSFNDEKFITKRNLWSKRALSADVIYNDAVHTKRSTGDSKGNQTERYNLT